MVTDNRFWTIATLLIQPYQKIIGPDNAFGFNFPPPETLHIEAALEQNLRSHPRSFELSTHPLELTQLIGYQSTLPPFPSAFVESIPTEPALLDSYNSHLDLPYLTGPHSPLPPLPATFHLPAAFGQPGPPAPALWDQYSSDLELPQLDGLPSPLPPLPATFGQARTNKLVLWNRCGSQLDSFVQSPTFHSDPNVLLESTSHDVIPKSDLEAPSSKRTKIQMIPDPPPFTSLNYLPSNHKPPMNARSQPLEGPPTASTNPKYSGVQISHALGLAHPMIFPTDIQCTQDHAVLTFSNHPLDSYQTSTDQQRNLSQNSNNNPNHSTGTSDVGLGIPQFHEIFNDEMSSVLQNEELETSAKKTMKRKKIESNSSVPAAAGASTASRGNRRGNISPKTYLFDFRWTEFKPSTINEQLVIELLDNIRVESGTNFFNFVAGLTNAQELDHTIQDKWPKKIFCLESSFPNSNEFFEFFCYVTRSRLSRQETENRQKLCTITRQKFILPSDDLSPHQRQIEAYKKQVLNDFTKLAKTCDKNGVEDFYSVNPQKSKIFKRAKKLVPIYTLYVDLIGTLIPAQALDMASQALEGQRESAGKCFLKLIQEVLLHDMERGFNYASEDREPSVIHSFTETIQKESISLSSTWSLMWKAVEYWALTSRKDLLKVHNFDGSNFKTFFNTLIFHWVAKQKLMIADNNLQVTWDSRNEPHFSRKCIIKRKKRTREK